MTLTANIAGHLKSSERQLALDLAKAAIRFPSTPFRYSEIDQFDEHLLFHPGLSGLRDRALLFEIRSLARHDLLDVIGDDERGSFLLNQNGLDFVDSLEHTAADPQDVAAGSDAVTQMAVPPADGGTSEPRTGSRRKVVARARLDAQRKYREMVDPKSSVIGGSPALLEVFEAMILYANAVDARTAVLLLGEPGVGKTHIAKLLHDSSNRASRRFKSVNAGGAGGDLTIQRSEWFGCGPNHGIQGVPTSGRKGHFGEVEGGTLFIDEFDAMSIELQANLLSVLDGHGVQQVGGQTVNPDVRCILATNADISLSAEKGRLRRDLLDRVGQRIVVPPLRERMGDVPALAISFAREHGATLEDRCIIALLGHDWPGNVRELKQVIWGAIGRARVEHDMTIRAEYLNILDAVVSTVTGVAASLAHEELWRLADRIARDEGYEPGGGLQRRAAEILVVRESQASKTYGTLGLSRGRDA